MNQPSFIEGRGPSRRSADTLVCRSADIPVGRAEPRFNIPLPTDGLAGLGTRDTHRRRRHFRLVDCFAVLSLLSTPIGFPRAVEPVPPQSGVASGTSTEARSSLPSDYRGAPFDNAAYRLAQQAEANLPALPYRAFEEALVVWNGSNSTPGMGWVLEGETNVYVRLDDVGPESRVIHFHARKGNYRSIGFGWEWTPPGKSGTPLQPYAAVSFSLKVTGPKRMQELFFGLTADQPEPISISPLEPSFADGNWHRITIPVRAMKWTPSPIPSEVRSFVLRTFVWNLCDCDVFVDRFSFDREVSTPGVAFPNAPAPSDSSNRGQVIPGRIECAFYDLGGEGVAYHDTTPINTLSGVLNQQAIHRRPHATAYHWNFRRNEAVDVSFVKDFADLNHPNPVDPPVNQLYIGGTEDGEWCNYTVNVLKAGTYRIMAAYGNIAGMKPLRFMVDGKPAVECPCPVVTGGMHKWTREEVGRLTFSEAGRHVLTLHYERGYNLGYFDFEEEK